mgnify:CR=1 FL=1
MITCETWGLSQYAALLAALEGLGYKAVDYASAMPDERHLILRHDLDFSLEYGALLGECERAAGVKSCYFVLLDTDNYNSFSSDSKRHLRALTGLGHQIGLHFDPKPHMEKSAPLESVISAQCRLLEDCAEAPVTVFSWHRPPKNFIGTEKEIGGCLNAYAKYFTQDIGYCSDSAGAWRYGHPLQHASIRAGRALQLLTHPIWWVGREGNAFERIRTLLEKRQDYLQMHVADNSKPYREGLREMMKPLLSES